MFWHTFCVAKYWSYFRFWCLLKVYPFLHDFWFDSVFENRSWILTFGWEVQNKSKIANWLWLIFVPMFFLLPMFNVQCVTGGVLVRASRRLGSKKLARKTSPAVLQVEVCWPVTMTSRPPCNILTCTGWHKMGGILIAWLVPELYPQSAYGEILATFATKMP